MTETKLVLADGSEIYLQDGVSIGSMKVEFETKENMVEVWKKLTNANLKQIQILTDNVASGRYTDLILEREISIVQMDGTILTNFALREKTEVEMLREEVAEFKAGQVIQDGAIADLGAITSAVVEKVEGGTQ